MTQSGSGNDTGSKFDADEFITRVFDRYPRLARVLLAFRQNPLSGNTVRILLKGEEEVTRDKQQVRSLPAPVMWQQNAPIVISHYVSYASETLPQYWNATLPDIKERYGSMVRYEHHDAPTPNPSMTEYKLAAAGRALQHQAGDEAFWTWFNAIMVDGVQSITEGYDLMEDLEIEIDRGPIQESVELDLYGNVIWNDIHSLLGKGDAETQQEIEQQLEESDPVFAVFVNGYPVEPSYDSIVGTVEEIRTAQTQAAAQAQAAQQDSQHNQSEGQSEDRTRQREAQQGEQSGQQSPVGNRGYQSPQNSGQNTQGQSSPHDHGT